MLNDPRISTCEQTSFACPESYVGLLDSGEWYYFRYRNGCAELYLKWGEIPYGPIEADAYTYTDVGDSLQGIFDSAEQRNDTFKALLDELDAAMQ